VEQEIREELNRLGELVSAVARQQAGEVAALARLVAGVLKSGGVLYFAGNGGSAADAQHLATEYVVRYSRSRAALPAIALTTDSSLLTACGNDFSFEEIFARQVEALCRPGDLLILHSTSGASPNLLRAARAARDRGVRVAALLGKGGGALKALVDLAIVIPSDDTSHIQELHLAIQHVVCALVERELGLV
jgi:D-sedoheptulose 7-phosphate isomerase